VTLRLSVVLTHPIQYYASWFRHIAAHCPELDLAVLYGTQPMPEQQGVGFGVPFAWDTPVTGGYRHRILRQPSNATDVSSGNFWGVRDTAVGCAIKESAPDVVLLPGWHSATYLQALYYCRLHRIPVLFRGDTHLGNCPPGWRGPIWRARTRLLLNAFSGYLAVGTRARKYLQSFGIPDSRVFNVPHCVDNQFFAAQAALHQRTETRVQLRRSFGLNGHDFVVLFVGKLEEKKRPGDVLDAVARLGQSVSVLLVGAGELGEGLRAHAKRLSVRLVFAGFLNQSQIGKAYAAADCLVLPSDCETWGLVVNEAMAAGLPCVVSDRVGCAPDLIKSGENGQIFRMGDIADLVTALQRLKRNKEQGYDWSAACRTRASSFSLEAATEGLLSACQAVFKARGSRRLRVLACCGHMVIVAGLERMTFEVLRVLREHDVPVHCIVNGWENHRIVELAEQIGASWTTGRYRQKLDRHTRSPQKLASTLWDIAATSFGLLRDSWRFRPTHILLPDYMAVLRNAPAVMILRILRIKIVLRLGNPPAEGSFYYLVWKWGINPLVDTFVCNSLYTQKELLRCDVPKSKVLHIYNTVPSRPSSTANGYRHDWRKLVFVGQLIPEKGAHVLLDAVASLLRKGVDAKLEIVGDLGCWEPPVFAGYRERLLARANQPDLVGRVKFLGYREDVPQILAGAGIHCCPSQPEQREGFGVVNIEAKMAGIPSVVTPTGALPELIRHGVDGWICSDISAGALVEGLEKFLANPEVAETAGQAALSSLEKFSRERFASSWWQLFSSRRACVDTGQS
jgi:glycosyltransferase involved in cell wall biosynthesis